MVTPHEYITLPAIRDRLKVSDRRLRHALDQAVVPGCKVIHQGRGSPRGIKGPAAISLGLAALMLDRGMRLGEIKRLFASDWWKSHHSSDDGRLYRSPKQSRERWTVLELAPPRVRAAPSIDAVKDGTWEFLYPGTCEAGEPILTFRVDLDELERRIFSSR